MKKIWMILATFIVIMAFFALEGNAEVEFTPGMEIQYGSYPQSEYGTDNTPVSWIVLDVEEDGTVFAISKYILGYHVWSDRWDSYLDLKISENDIPGYAYSFRLLGLNEVETYDLGAGTPTAYALKNKKYQTEDKAYQKYCWWTDIPYYEDEWFNSWYSTHTDIIGCYVDQNGTAVTWTPGSIGGYGAGVDFGFRPVLVLTPVPAIPELSLWTDEGLNIEADTLNYCEGNLMAFGDFEHNSIFYLHVKAEYGRGRTVKLELPAGFSFSKDTSKDSDEKPIGIEEEVVVPVYSTYAVQSVERVVFKAEIDEKTELEIPVKKGSREILCVTDKNISDNTGTYHETIDLGWENSYVNGVPQGYEQKLANLGAYLSFSIYNEWNISQSLYNLGCHSIKYFNTGGNINGSDCCMGIKTMTDDSGVNKYLVAVVVRGTIGLQEWIGNFIVGDEDNAQSFYYAAQQVINVLDQYLGDNGLSKSKVEVYTCGHSRGAAVANNIVHLLTEKKEYIENGVTGYTYATPNTAQNPNLNDNVYNFKYANDVATYVPQGYKNHGKTYVIGLTDSIPQVVRTEYTRHTGREFEAEDNDFVIGAIAVAGAQANAFLPSIVDKITFVDDKISKYGFIFKVLGKGEPMEKIKQKNMFLYESLVSIGKAHSGETYVSWVVTKGKDSSTEYSEDLLKMKKENFYGKEALLLFRLKNDAVLNKVIRYEVAVELFGKLNQLDAKHGEVMNTAVMCPVNVSLKASSGEVVVSIVDHTLNYCDESRAFAISEDEADFIMFPADKGYYLDIEGNEDGKMTLGVNSIDKSMNIKDRTVIEDIPIKASEHYLMEPEYGKLNTMQVVSSTGETFGEEEKKPLQLSSGLTSLPDKCFAGDKTLQGVLIIPEGVKTIGSKVFSDTNIMLLVLPESVQSIAEDAFDGMRSSVQFRCHENSMAEGWLMDHGFSYTVYK